MDARARFDKLLPAVQEFIGRPCQAKIPFSGRRLHKALYLFNWYEETDGEHQDKLADLLGDVEDEEQLDGYIRAATADEKEEEDDQFRARLADGVVPFAYVVNDGAFDDGEMEDWQCEGVLLLDLRDGDGPVVFAEVDGTIMPSEGIEVVAANLAELKLSPYNSDEIGTGERIEGDDDEDDDAEDDEEEEEED